MAVSALTSALTDKSDNVEGVKRQPRLMMEATRTVYSSYSCPRGITESHWRIYGFLTVTFSP